MAEQTTVDPLQDTASANGKASGARVMGFPAYRERTAALGELHSRPHPTLTPPRILIQLALMLDGGVAADKAVISDLCRGRGASGPAEGARHHLLPWSKGQLRWERHSEFSTYLFDGPANARTLEPVGDMPFSSGFPAPGTVISGVRVEVRSWTKPSEKVLESFDAASLCFSTVENGMAAIATDFRQDADGLTRIVIFDKGITPPRAGALAQRVIEIETYRTLALLGLPLAQRLSPRLRNMEDRLADLTLRMRNSPTTDCQAQLEDLNGLTAELESDAASTLFRFGASKAYDEIVTERVAALGEVPVTGYESWNGFLQRRMAPAMRTCRSIEERQANMSRKLARAATLLRTRVDVELEKQNSALLTSMNRRAQQQLRLQHTVEGLSVAAVTYYLVGLVAFMAKGAKEVGYPFSAELTSAISVPIIALSVFWLVRRIRGANSEYDI
jgi:uncharacterized membrane-anchored protein